MSIRRTPALTSQARERFELLVEANPRILSGDTLWLMQAVRDIAGETGLEPKQVRDALFGESADTWRQAYAARLREVRDAVSER